MRQCSDGYCDCDEHTACTPSRGVACFSLLQCRSDCDCVVVPCVSVVGHWSSPLNCSAVVHVCQWCGDGNSHWLWHHYCVTTGLCSHNYQYWNTDTHVPTALRLGLHGIKPIWILLKQETVSGIGISWAICKSAPRSRQITMLAPHHSVFTGQMPFLPPSQ